MKSVALILLAGVAAVQSPVELPKPLAESFATLASTPSLTVTYKFGLVGELPRETKLTLSKPNLFKLTTEDGFLLSDGRTVYEYKKADNTYTQNPLNDDQLLEFSRRPEVYGWYAFLDKTPAKNIITAKSSAVRSVAGMDLVPVDLSLKRGRGPGSLFIDPQTKMPKAFTIRIEDKEYVGHVTDLEIGKEPIETGTFAFHAPAGAKLFVPIVAEPKYSSVKKIMEASCMPCHNAQNARGGYNLSTYEGVVAATTPGNGANSILVKVLRETGANRMPKNKPALPSKQIKAIEEWIDKGAKND